KFDSCMPHLQRLNMQQAFSASCYEVLFSKNTFVNLQQLILCGWGFTAHKLETLFHVKRKLEVLNADEASNTTGMHSRSWKGFDEVVVRSPLKRLYVRGFFRPSTLLRELESFKNLTLLSFSYACYMGPDDILPIKCIFSNLFAQNAVCQPRWCMKVHIKRLLHLEHLHLSGNYDDYSRMTADCLRVIFGPADWETSFPSRLKFLSLPDWLHLDDSVVEEIALNCEQLRSLSLARCPLVTVRGFRVIAKSLKELRFLDINEIAGGFSALLFAEVGAKDLPHLVYLSAHRSSSSSDAELSAVSDFKMSPEVDQFHLFARNN
uniref:Uncharacterized protein n=1 Tax=Parascaris univalens TaxID=6257 RepID=A0A915AWH1_PARUN